MMSILVEDRIHVSVPKGSPEGALFYLSSFAYQLDSLRIPDRQIERFVEIAGSVAMKVDSSGVKVLKILDRALEKRISVIQPAVHFYRVGFWLDDEFEFRSWCFKALGVTRPVRSDDVPYNFGRYSSVENSTKADFDGHDLEEQERLGEVIRKRRFAHDKRSQNVELSNSLYSGSMPDSEY